MATDSSVVFLDLAGSSATYEALGSDRVAALVSSITRWAERVCQAYGSRNTKLLGDGVLAWFPSSLHAVNASLLIQQRYAQRLAGWAESLRMGLKIGIASGAVVQLHADAYGDSVNLAARLSDMAGPHAIWADAETMRQLRGTQETQIPGVLPTDLPLLQGDAIRARSLGVVRVPGLTQPHSVFQIFWDERVEAVDLTRPGTLAEMAEMAEAMQIEPGVGASLTLDWKGAGKTFRAGQVITIGRILQSGFAVPDSRVSRQHATIRWTASGFELVDESSYGTWVRFAGNKGPEITLRRSSCLLYDSGEISLSGPFSDPDAPLITYSQRSA